MDSQDQSSNDQAPAQDQSSDKALVNFTPFPKLSPDLRVMVWKATLTPRLLSRQCLSVNSNKPLNSIEIPPLLGVNAETRYEALKWYKNIAISAERLHYLRLRRNFWVPKEEKLRILFNPEIDVIVDETLRCDLYPLYDENHFYANRPGRSPLLIDPDFVKKVQVSPDVFMNSSWTWKQTLRNWQDSYHGFEDIQLRWYAIRRIKFIDLRFNNLNEFIVQDVDCALRHQLDSPETRAICKNFLSIMFKAETTRESKSHIQAFVIVPLSGSPHGANGHWNSPAHPISKSTSNGLRTECEEAE
ncbi:hypothetical protein BOTCAL_0141g00080 [Botryotinia calthae]|uniref:2EXR domain-containing protein n=1 Tax=Botryotinia calthae TaxID=38488 RepID=A0A4Y8D373_9HELO|nr:hypothetical protein BOTCAL_0141g00080 [Botryotinia calthae]